jgi:hypothetical protein
MSEMVRVYINAKPVDVDAAATALEAVEAWNPTEAAAIRSGERMITDSRGIPARNDAPVHNGAIFRIVRARQEAADDNDITFL